MGELKQPRDKVVASERAKRIKALRELVGYSRHKFCEKYAKYGIKLGTLQSWEDVRWNGVSEKGAATLVKIFKEEGINITVEWLLFGVGDNPLKHLDRFKIAGAITKVSPDETIAQELRFFHQLNEGAVDTVIADDGLAPWLMPGDRVAGKRLFEHEIAEAIDHPCIIQTLAGNVVVRWLKKGDDVDHYTLVCTNPNTKVNEPHLENIKLFSAAPIVWIRRLHSNT
jgi:DNA-binding transcriptional regulator YiaG